jgi:hypothetical protein
LRDDGSGPVVTAGSVVSGLGRMFMAFSLLIGYAHKHLLSSLRAPAKQSRNLSVETDWIASSLCSSQ